MCKLPELKSAVVYVNWGFHPGHHTLHSLQCSRCYRVFAVVSFWINPCPSFLLLCHAVTLSHYTGRIRSPSCANALWQCPVITGVTPRRTLSHKGIKLNEGSQEDAIHIMRHLFLPPRGCCECEAWIALPPLFGFCKVCFCEAQEVLG